MPTDQKEENFDKIPSLEEFLVLSEDEQKLLTTLIDLSKSAKLSGDWTPIQKSITAHSTEEWTFSIIKLAEHIPEINELCKKASMQEYWLDQWLKIQNADNDYQMQAQPLFNYFDLYRGYFFYLLAADSFGDGHGEMSPQVLAYLSKAHSYHSFHASRQLNGYLIKTLRETATQDGVDFSAMLASLQTLAKLHLTPGYILLGRTSFELAQFKKRFSSEGEETKAISEHYALALRAIYMAEQLIPLSQASIANACVGRELDKCFDLENLGWDGYKALIIQEAGDSLDDKAVKAIYREADALIEQHVQEMSLFLSSPEIKKESPAFRIS